MWCITPKTSTLTPVIIYITPLNTAETPWRFLSGDLASYVHNQWMFRLLSWIDDPPPSPPLFVKIDELEKKAAEVDREGVVVVSSFLDGVQ